MRPTQHRAGHSPELVLRTRLIFLPGRWAGEGAGEAVLEWGTDGEGEVCLPQHCDTVSVALRSSPCFTF